MRPRLTCFDQWAGQQAWQAPAASAAQEVPPAAPSLVDTTLPATRMIEVAQTAGCRDPQYSSLSRFWELETGSDCGTFSFRGYRPITASVVTASSVNRQPTSSAPDHPASQSIPTGAPRHGCNLRAHQDRPGPVHPEPSHTQGIRCGLATPSSRTGRCSRPRSRALSARPTMSPR